MMKNAFYFILKAFFVLKYLNFCVEWHGVKVGPGRRDLKPRDPGPPSKFKSGTPGPPLRFKNWTPSPFFDEFIFCRVFHRFFYTYFFVCLFK